MARLVEAPQHGPVGPDGDPADGRRIEVGAPRHLVAHAEGPRHRRLDGRHVADHDDVALGRVGRQLVAGAPAPVGRASASDSPPGGAKSGRRASASTRPGGHVAERVARRTRRSRARSSARRPRRAAPSGARRSRAAPAAAGWTRRGRTGAEALGRERVGLARPPRRRAAGRAARAGGRPALAAVRPWRTTISTTLSHRRRPRVATSRSSRPVAQEALAPGRVGEPEARGSPTRAPPRRRASSTTVQPPPGQLGQLVVVERPAR